MPSFPAVILETVLTHLATLFLTGANGDPAAARIAASQMLDAYHPGTIDELRLAANIISFSFQALEALAQAAAPDLSLTRILRLRGSAVSLSRESAKAERSLAQLQKSRQQAQQSDIQQPEPEPAAIKPIVRIPAPAQPTNLTSAKAEEERQIDLRIAASIKRAEAKVAAMANAATPAPTAQLTA